MIPAPVSSSEPIVRLAHADEANAVALCVKAAFERYIERMGKPPAPMISDYPSLIAANRVWAAVHRGRICGVLVQYETEYGFYIETVAVSPSHQTTGVGRALLLFAEREACQRGFGSIYLSTNTRMIENQLFYPKIGYVEYDRRNEDGYDRIFYRKQLARRLTDEDAV